MPNSFIRVAVLGDKSGSMDVAIRSASVISSLLCVAFNADLKFFDQRCVTPKVVPRKVEDTIEIVDTSIPKLKFYDDKIAMIVLFSLSQS